MTRVVPMYSFDNARLRNYSESEVVWMESVESIYVRRKAGRIVSARFRSASREVVPCRGTAITCARFTHKERIGKTKIVAHNSLPPEHARSERERRLKLAAQRKLEARAKVVSDLPVQLAA
jgi:hypothetical protein